MKKATNLTDCRLYSEGNANLPEVDHEVHESDPPLLQLLAFHLTGVSDLMEQLQDL